MSLTCRLAVLVLSLGLLVAARATSLNMMMSSEKRRQSPKGTGDRFGPDTLDLAERARLAINYYLYNHEPEQGYSLYHICKFDVDPRKPTN